jgi:predicted Zn-dependent protease
METMRKIGACRSVWVAVLAVGLLLTPGCTTDLNPVSGKRQMMGFSWSQEQQIGQQADAEIVQEYGLYDDPELAAYVTRVGQKVLAETELRAPEAAAQYKNTQFTFRVLNSPVVNAFAVPGGYVYVTRGLLTHLDNEAQLAVVLGHEIGHVAARHSARQAAKAQLGQLGLMAGAILGSTVLENPQVAEQIVGLGGQAMQLLMTKYSRDAEREADQLGVGWAAERGYDAAESAAFFQTLKRIGERDGMRLPAWQSTHPDPGEREQTVKMIAAKNTPPGAILSKGEDEFLKHIDGVIVGDDPREGFVRGNTFYHPELRFQFPVPQGWKVQNERSSVMMMSPNRDAAMVFQLTGAKSAQEAAQKFAATQGLQVIDSKATRVNGQNAMAVVGQGSTQQGTVGLLNYFIEYNGRVYSFRGMSAAQQFDSHRQQFQRAMSGFARVTDSDVVSVKPSRLAVVTADRSATFASFLPTSDVPGMTAEDVAILNQMQMNQAVAAGTKLKIPRGGVDINRSLGTSRIREQPPGAISRERAPLGAP